LPNNTSNIIQFCKYFLVWRPCHGSDFCNICQTELSTTVETFTAANITQKMLSGLARMLASNSLQLVKFPLIGRHITDEQIEEGNLLTEFMQMTIIHRAQQTKIIGCSAC